jgi:dolichyl-phosphate beta-glucosyltransferase
MDAPSLSIVIPAYNEAARIGSAVAAARAFLDRRAGGGEIVVVDDGSGDSTAEIVQAQAGVDARVKLRRFDHNRGKGAAVRDGVLASTGARVLFMDADLATPLEELARLERALDDGADVAIGSRALGDSRILRRQHPLRETMGRTFNLLVRALVLGGIKDTQCGFKLFTRASADALFAEATIDRFAFDVELLLLARGRFRVAEVPVAWRHVEQSKVSPVRDAARMAYDLVSLRIATALRRRSR